MKKFNNFKDNNSILHDFKKIDNEVSEIISDATKSKQRKFKSLKIRTCLKYAICVMLTCAISVGATVLVMGSTMKTKSTQATIDKPIGDIAGNISPAKDSFYTENYFDSFIAFSGGSIEFLHTDELLKTNLIDEESKQEIKAYSDRNTHNPFFNVYLGIKDGKDTVVLTHMDAPYEVFVYESKLGYSLSDIVNKFEILSGKKLSQEFLKSSVFYEGFNYEMGGITMRFVQGYSDGFSKRFLVEYYSAIIDGMLYVLPSSQIK